MQRPMKCGFQKYCCDFSVLAVLLRKAGEARWERILTIAFVSSQTDHLSDHSVKVPFYMYFMNRHVNEYIRLSPCFR